jgi:hypothetical protein
LVKRAAVMVGVPALAGFACAALLDVDAVGYAFSDAGADALAETSPTGDAGPDLDACPEPHYHDVTDPANWSSFDLHKANADITGGFFGGAFDGRYVYFVPQLRIVVRYDTSAPFGESTAWQSFDVSRLPLPQTGYAGAIFDGTRVYFVPSTDAIGTANGVIVAYQTAQPFADAAAWESFDLQSVAPDGGSARAFIGALWDGQRVILAPNGAALGAVHDPTKALGAGWVFETSEAPAVGGAILDGAAYAPGRMPSRVLMRSASGWTNILPAALQAGVHVGTVSDGRRLVFVPTRYADYAAVALELDPLANVAGTDAWRTFDMLQLDDAAIHYSGGAFDGRYVYFVPTAYDGLARVDRAGAFADAAAWTLYHLAGVLDGATKSFAGAVFDGKYVYFVPVDHQTVLRFDARDARCPVAVPASSFF